MIHDLYDLYWENDPMKCLWFIGKLRVESMIMKVNVWWYEHGCEWNAYDIKELRQVSSITLMYKFVSFVGCILFTKSLSCNVAIINRDAVYFRIFKVFQKSYFKCSRKILCRFQLREVRSHVSIRTAQSCVRTPISVEKLRTVQGCIRLDVMATRLDTLQSSRRFHLSFADMEWEDSLHPSKWQGHTIQTPRSLIRKLRACIQHPSRRQGNTVRTRSLLWQLHADRVQLSGL
jgi:hypothetical protein